MEHKELYFLAREALTVLKTRLPKEHIAGMLEPITLIYHFENNNVKGWYHTITKQFIYIIKPKQWKIEQRNT